MQAEGLYIQGQGDKHVALVIAIPNSDVFLAVGVDHSLQPAALTGMAVQARDGYARRPRPASDDLYWWRDGTLQALTLTGDQLQIPPELAGLLGAG